MNQQILIAEDEKTHVIITYKDSHHFITSKQEQALKQMSTGSHIKVDGNTISAGDIAEVLTTEKYYEAHPDKQPNRRAYDDLTPILGNVYTRSKKDAKELMLKGMEKRYTLAAKQFRQTINKNIMPEVKYNTWEEAKAAGVYK